MLIPGLARIEHLHVAHPALDQPTRNDAARGVVFGDRVIDAVEFFDVLRLLRNIQRLLRSHLHLGRELIAGDACLQIKLSRMQGQVVFVEGLQQIELTPLRCTGE